MPPASARKRKAGKAAASKKAAAAKAARMAETTVKAESEAASEAAAAEDDDTASVLTTFAPASVPSPSRYVNLRAVQWEAMKNLLRKREAEQALEEAAEANDPGALRAQLDETRGKWEQAEQQAAAAHALLGDASMQARAQALREAGELAMRREAEVARQLHEAGKLEAWLRAELDKAQRARHEQWLECCDLKRDNTWFRQELDRVRAHLCELERASYWERERARDRDRDRDRARDRRDRSKGRDKRQDRNQERDKDDPEYRGWG